jgi:hypothetical protein
VLPIHVALVSRSEQTNSAQGSLRGFVDTRTDHPDLDHGLAQTDATLADARIGWRGATASAEAPRQPMRLEEEIERLLS